MGFRHFDIGFATAYTAREIGEYAAYGERHGFNTCWIAELYYHHSSVATAMSVAQQTNRIKIGFGILSPFTRHPSLIAMEIATIDEFSLGRVILGLGIAQIATDRHGVTRPRPPISLKEAIEIIRYCLAYRSFTYDGSFFRIVEPGISLGFKPYRSKVPIFVGGMSPKTIQTAARIADGVILGMFSSPAFVKFVLDEISKGAKNANRDPSQIDLRSIITFSVGEDSREAKEAVRTLLLEYFSEKVSTSAARPGSPRIKYSGVTDNELRAVKTEVSSYIERGELKKAAECIPLDMIDRLTVAGTPDECVQRLREFEEAGLPVPILYHVFGPEVAKGIKLAAEKVVPRLR